MFKICNQMEKIRKKKGYTQEKLSELTKLSQQYLSNVERGVTVPSLQRAILIADALEVCHCNLFWKCEE